MIIPLKLQLLSLVFITALSSTAQEERIATLNVGDAAPPLRIRQWLKGTPVKQFEKGKIYVVEFWATWCRPCVAAMPNLSALAKEYKDKVTVIGVDIYEKETTSIAKIKSFVDSLGQSMHYNVAADDSNYMAVAWVDATIDPAIPKSFVIDAEGKVAWIGHPRMLDEVLPAIVSNTWDVDEALARRNEERRLNVMDREVQYLVLPYVYNQFIPNHPFKPDTVLALLDTLVTKEPKLKYAPLVSYYTFAALLHTDLQKAYEYGKAVMITPTYEEPNWYAVIWGIEQYGDKLNLPPSFYLLGVEAWQERINHIAYPQVVNLPRMYKNMAAFYWCANEQSKAIEAIEKAIAIMKSRKDFTVKEMAELESLLQQYGKKESGTLKAF